jgi:hypothetical protein
MHEFNDCMGSLEEFNTLYRDAPKFMNKFFEYLQMSTAAVVLLLHKFEV